MRLEDNNTAGDRENDRRRDLTTEEGVFIVSTLAAMGLSSTFWLLVGVGHRGKSWFGSSNRRDDVDFDSE